MSYPSAPGSTPVCYRHPDRTTYVRCNRCQRYACGDCMRSAAVGQQCVDCVRAGAASVRQPRTALGGRWHGSGKPIVTWTLIGINVVMFVLQMASGQLERELTLWPPAVADGEVYRLVTSAFLHYGTMHILFNMLALYVVGPQLELALGRLRFGLLYGLSALGGSLLVYLLSPLNTATAGASGAIFGLFGAAFVIGRRLNLDVRGVVILIGLNLVITFVAPLAGAGAISWQGHLGGLITGALVAAAFVYAPAKQRTAVAATVTAAFLVVFVALVWWRTGVLLDMFGGAVIIS
ncbi:rhomboid family intramembrane serine protease [[Mycobacterium] burgundiense]|uniref:Rhomboid family intramembrane serine protease n=1 Tax=[Mycobacterium] burgundiense TaxID=3064286 RepID=A0ABN9NQS0_9MYCO|nr:rhomboid family intramembrane serine protease [Mycolicibacterium sp. MU0053]CAJ1510506.1 rhomboid family intramembrane serine protease [Mycolicibacterium sp. MU0053]